MRLRALSRQLDPLSFDTCSTLAFMADLGVYNGFVRPVGLPPPGHKWLMGAIGISHHGTNLAWTDRQYSGNRIGSGLVREKSLCERRWFTVGLH